MVIKHLVRASLLGLSISLYACVDKDVDTEHVYISSIPEQPIIIEADWTYKVGTGDTAQTVTVEGPWFQITPKIFNGATQDLVIVGALFTVRGYGVDGAPIETIVEFEPGDLLVNQDSDETNDQYHLYYLPIGEGTHEVPPGGGPEQSTGHAIRMRVGGLPTKEDGAASYNYTVDAVFEGWFGDPVNPQKSFRTMIRFQTNHSAAVGN